MSIRVDGSPDPLDPPDHLGPDERQRFIELVDATDTKHFRPTDLPLLARYCEADVLPKGPLGNCATVGR